MINLTFWILVVVSGTSQTTSVTFGPRFAEQSDCQQAAIELKANAHGDFQRLHAFCLKLQRPST